MLASTDAPLVTVGEQGPLGVDPKVFAAITLFALSNGALINMIMASRLVYGMSEEGIMPGFFGRVLSGRRTPITAIVFTTILGIILVSTGDLADLADTTVMLLLVAFTAVEHLGPGPAPRGGRPQHFRAPTFAPILAAIACVVLIVDNEAEVFLRAGILLGIGVLLWVAAYAGGHRTGEHRGCRFGSVSDWEKLAGLPLRVESYELSGHDREYGDFTRPSTLVHLHGDGQEGLGEDVVYDALDQIAHRDAGPDPRLHRGRRPWANSASSPAGSTSSRWRRRAMEASRNYRRWAYESAALDLGAQAGGDLAAPGPRPRPRAAQLRLLDPPDRLRGRGGLEHRADLKAARQVPGPRVQARPRERLDAGADR